MFSDLVPISVFKATFPANQDELKAIHYIGFGFVFFFFFHYLRACHHLH